MHIQEGTNTTLTTCTKMTEEVDRRHGVNGNGSSKGPSEDAPAGNAAVNATGGRLKFFKDGKFILELVRGCAREGERAGWVSVPRKTFWPPAAAPAAACASLSASDDNSSVHSSPWQRDHCWKQPAPRKNASRHHAMYYVRPASLPRAAIAAAARRKRRRPHDATPADTNGHAATAASDDDQWTDRDREKYYHMKLKKPYQYHKLRVYKKTGPAVRRKELAKTIEKLRERVAALPAPVNAKLASCRTEHAMVSPRKRILRELERVSLEDGSKRRAKTVPALSTASYPPSPGPSPGPGPSGHAKPEPRANGGAPPPPPPRVPTKNVSSYSIHSLLSMGDEARRSPTDGDRCAGSKRSPHHAYAASRRTDSPASSARSPDLSPSPDQYRYRYMEPPAPAAYRPWPPELPYAYGYGYAPLYRAPAPAPPLWMQYALPAAPPGPWAPLPHPLLTDHIPKDEPTSDLPLNLSKH